MTETVGAEVGGAADKLVFEVPAGAKLTVGRPSLVVLPNGRLLVAFDLTGPDAKGLPGKKYVDARSRWSQTKVFSSTDGGEKWDSVASLPCRGGVLFRDGGDVYLLGEANGTVQLSRSPDGGGSWSLPTTVVEPSSGAVGGKLDFTPYFSAPAQCGESWFVLAWRGESAGWSALSAPKGAALANRKLWRSGPATGPMSGLAGALSASGAGIPAAGVSLGYRAISAGLLPLPPKHPWLPADRGDKPMLLALFSAATGHEDVAAGLLLDPETLAFSPLAGAPAPWLWVNFPGGHSAFSVATQGAGAGQIFVAGNALKPLPGAGLPIWGRATLEDASRTRLRLWRSGTFPAFSSVATFCDEKVAVKPPETAPAHAPGGRKDRRNRHGGDSGGGAAPQGVWAGIRRDPALVVAGGSAWMVCRCGAQASRHASDCLSVRLFKAPLPK